MRGQRPPGAAPAIAARAESLPLDDDAVDAAMASITIHHWERPQDGLRELARVARHRVVILTFDLAHLPAWQQEYLAEGLEIERPALPQPGADRRRAARHRAGRAAAHARGLHRRLL